ncbi:MAG: DnaJ domain-containing protein [Deltaproteobacteria bacterium]|nr:DnaJ domain-containing protein [Deltaproteobacteria bacterium]
MDDAFLRPYRDIDELRARARRVLGVSADASPEEVTRVFRSLARERHPDVVGPGGDFAGLVNAYLVLTRPDPRGFPVEDPPDRPARDPETLEEYLAWWKERFGP